MSQTKVQLIAPIGVVTASTLETTGVLTATTFVGDIAGTVTGITSTTDNLNLGIITATSFAGDFTGIGSGLTGTPNVVAGVVTATKFIGNTPGTVSGIADGTNINAGIITATSFVGNLTGNAAGLSTTTGHANLGIVTATSFHGSGANLDGVSSGPVAQQAVTANSSTTTIDLSSGNLIYMTQSANTTVAFANTEGNTDVVYLVRTKDDNTTARTLTWPSGVVWDGGTTPTLVDADQIIVNDGKSVSIESAKQAVDESLIDPVFVGDKPIIEKLAKDIKWDISKYEVIHEPVENNTALIAAKMASEGKIKIVVKGRLLKSSYL